MSNWGKWEDQIICPWCGYKDIDSWEYNDSDDRKYYCPVLNAREALAEIDKLKETE